MPEASTNLVLFYKHWKQNNKESERQGRPIGEELDYVEIRGLGQDKTVVKRAAALADQNEYHREWGLYQRGLEQVAEGTPLREWPVMTPEEILRLNSHSIHTIEALVAVSDAGLQEMGHGARQIQQRAKAYLEEDAPKAAAANLRVLSDEQRTEIERLTNENAGLQAQVDELVKANVANPGSRGPGGSPDRMVPEDMEITELKARLEKTEALLEEATTPAKRRPGRPRKAA